MAPVWQAPASPIPPPSSLRLLLPPEWLSCPPSSSSFSSSFAPIVFSCVRHRRRRHSSSSSFVVVVLVVVRSRRLLPPSRYLVIVVVVFRPPVPLAAGAAVLLLFLLPSIPRRHGACTWWRYSAKARTPWRSRRCTTALLRVLGHRCRRTGRNYSAINYEVKCKFGVDKVRFVRARSRKVCPPSRILDKLQGPQTTVFHRKNKSAARFVHNPREITGSGDSTISKKCHTGGYSTWWSRAVTTCFHVSRPPRGVSNLVVSRWNRVFYVSRPPRGVSNMVVPSWIHVSSRVQATQRGYLTWWSRAGTAQRGYRTWWSRAGTACFRVSRPPRGYLTWWPRAVTTCFFPERAGAQGSLLAVCPRV